MKGQDFKFIPFGIGRRIRIELPPGHKMVHLMLAFLFHSCSWKLEDSVKPEDKNMNEMFGIIL